MKIYKFLMVLTLKVVVLVLFFNLASICLDIPSTLAVIASAFLYVTWFFGSIYLLPKTTYNYYQKLFNQKNNQNEKA
jgi:hypothetical protein